MAIFRGGSLAQAVSGKVGGVEFVLSPSGPVLRARGRRSAPASAPRLAARATLERLWGLWRALSDDERRAWVTAASGVRVRNRLGVSRVVRGFELYFQTAIEVYDGFPPAGLVPPAVMQLYAPTLVRAYFLEGGPYAVTSSGSPFGVSTLYERGYVQVGRGPAQLTGFNRYRAIETRLKPTATMDWYTAIAADGIPVFDGTRIAWASAWRVLGGLVGARVWATGTVGDVPWVVDDFERAGLLYYTGSTAFYSIVGSPVISGVRSLQYSAPGPAVSLAEIYSLSGLYIYPLRGHVFEVWVRRSAQADRVGVYFARRSSESYYFWQTSGSGSPLLLRGDSGGGAVIVTMSAWTMTPDTWFRLVVSWRSDGFFDVRVFDAVGGQVSIGTGTDTMWDSGGIGFRGRNVAGQAATVHFDGFRVTGRAS